MGFMFVLTLDTLSRACQTPPEEGACAVFYLMLTSPMYHTIVVILVHVLVHMRVRWGSLGPHAHRCIYQLARDRARKQHPQRLPQSIPHPARGHSDT
jgi:hypothetical protein